MATKTKNAVPAVTAVEAYNIVSQDVNARKDDKVRHIATIARGDKFRQGDINILVLGSSLKDAENVKAPKKVVFSAKTKEVWSNKVAQLAPGDTQGSRHIIATDNVKAVTVFNLENANPLQGPIVHSSERFSITHPEHGHFDLPPGSYFISYQRAHADELRRIRD